MKRSLTYILIFSLVITVGNAYFAKIALAEMACRYHEGANGVPKEGDIVPLKLNGQDASHDRELCEQTAAGDDTQAPGLVYWGEAPQAGDFGTCTQTDNDTGQLLTLPHMTKQACMDSANASTRTTFVGWTPDSSDGSDDDATANTTYNLLSPLPGPNGMVPTYEIGSSNPLGLYLNMAITIFIGICAVLAVIMIVVGGLEYMTSELVSSKESGKEKATRAIFGLILALAAWPILHQINPGLLNADLKNLTTQTVTVDLMEEVETEDTALSSDDGAPAAATAGCPEGIVRVSGISVCKRLAQHLANLVTAAKATPACASVSGAGFRSPERQKQLRRANCSGNIDDRSARCTPPTAIPGASRHQQGLAIDFMVRVGAENKFFKATGPTSACFNWFKANANKYHFKNLPSEPWHWSVDGK